MQGQGEAQDLSAQNTISYVMKTDVLCYSFLCMGNSLKIRVCSEQLNKDFCLILLLSTLQKGS